MACVVEEPFDIRFQYIIDFARHDCLVDFPHNLMCTSARMPCDCRPNAGGLGS
jgi:hypothetical protein